MGLLANLRVLRDHSKPANALVRQLDKRNRKWRVAVENGDLSGLDPATIVLLLKLLMLFLKIAPLIFEDE